MAYLWDDLKLFTILCFYFLNACTNSWQCCSQIKLNECNDISTINSKFVIWMQTHMNAWLASKKGGSALFTVLCKWKSSALRWRMIPLTSTGVKFATFVLYGLYEKRVIMSHQGRCVVSKIFAPSNHSWGVRCRLTTETTLVLIPG